MRDLLLVYEAFIADLQPWYFGVAWNAITAGVLLLLAWKVLRPIAFRDAAHYPLAIGFGHFLAVLGIDALFDCGRLIYLQEASDYVLIEAFIEGLEASVAVWYLLLRRQFSFLVRDGELFRSPRWGREFIDWTLSVALPALDRAGTHPDEAPEIADRLAVQVRERIEDYADLPQRDEGLG